jgi:putative hemolysin
MSPADERLFKLEFQSATGLARRLVNRFAAPLESLLAVDRLNETYQRCRGGVGGLEGFLQRVLDELGVCHHIASDDLARIPKTGPLFVVANHPFGAIDGIVLAAVLRSVRPDVKVMANYLLGRIPDLRDLFIFVDPFGGRDSAQANVRSMRQSLRWIKDGGALAAFPAGEVAHLNLRDRQVSDPAWSEQIARIVRHTGAPVLPVYFDGHNSALFQVLGMIHPRLRTIMLPRELYRRQHDRKPLEMRVGTVIPHKRLAAIDNDAELTDYLRRRTFLLRHRARPNVDVSSVASQEPIVKPVSPDLLENDVATLPESQVLVRHDDSVVYFARAGQIRNVLREIGRLREATFRPIGEGTGRAIDLDTFDYDYVHLFVWNPSRREIVGAYRLGRSDELVAAKGRQGLYTSTLFSYSQAVLDRMGPALEMGRSFVRVEYQRSYTPLLMLWKGIGHYVVQNPQYRRLFGPVSISSRYQSVSKQLMVRFLQLQHAARDPGLVEPRNPFQARRLRGWDDESARALLTDSDEVSALVADLEPDQKGLPVLVRQYLKLGAKFHAFNVDPNFSDALDGLIEVDLAKTDARVLERYMTREGYKRFMSHHASDEVDPK